MHHDNCYDQKSVQLCSLHHVDTCILALYFICSMNFLDVQFPSLFSPYSRYALAVCCTNSGYFSLALRISSFVKVKYPAFSLKKVWKHYTRTPALWYKHLIIFFFLLDAFIIASLRCWLIMKQHYGFFNLIFWWSF